MRGVMRLCVAGYLMLSMAPACVADAQQKAGAKTPAEWTIVAYLQADNNLAPFATYNINDMQLAPLSDSVNMLVEWDQPNNSKTWRYRIVKGGRIEDASLSTEMGLNPVQEIVDMMKWAKTNYDAKKFATILWNHGSGIIDPRFKFIDKIMPATSGAKNMRPTYPWLEIPGLSILKDPADPRGILFDDSQNTYATNQDLSNAFSRVKSEVLGASVDILGMDACLMAMIEVCYQIKDYAKVLVGSEETEPGEGWAYSGFLTALCEKPASYDASQLAGAMVAAYGLFYNKNVSDYTQSAIDLSKVEAVKQNIASLITAIAACKKIDSVKTKKMVVAARRAATSFAVTDYIDLYSFYTALIQQFGNVRKPVPSKPPVTPAAKNYLAAASAVLTVLKQGRLLITDAVIASVAGSQYSKTVKGLSIYYPKGTVHRSYIKTKFAQNTQWVSFIKENQ